MKHVVLAALLTFSATALAETNYCHDPKVAESWEQIKRNHPGERDIEGLAALRERLCREVEAGAMTVREATERFEAGRAGACHRGAARVQPPARGRRIGVRAGRRSIERPLQR